MTGTVFDFKRYSLHDGPGIRVCVHLKGCPLSCYWCHNPESQVFEPRPLFRPERCIACGACVEACPNSAVANLEDGLATDWDRCTGAARCSDVCPSEAREICGEKMTVPEVMKRILKERIFFEQSGGGVTLSGGEPLSQPEFAMALLRECKRNDLHTAIDTSGFTSPAVLMETTPFTDLFLYDVKVMDPEKHKKYTGVDNEIILSNLSKLVQSGADVWARMPFIPTVNTDEMNLRAVGKLLSSFPGGGVKQLNLLPYHSAAEDKHGRWGMEYKLKEILPPTEQSLRNAAAVIENFGVNVLIGG